jgi:hypothetical protein
MNGAFTTMPPVLHYCVMLRHKKNFIVLKDCLRIGRPFLVFSQQCCLTSVLTNYGDRNFYEYCQDLEFFCWQPVEPLFNRLEFF